MRAAFTSAENPDEQPGRVTRVRLLLTDGAHVLAALVGLALVIALGVLLRR